ncbi:U24 protein [macacine betaherpesvirus 9]|uniref:U24 protein n=1 Tax=macacine betaherpesvirus 9 TaxID=2560568 RepID=A0A192XPC6_9BETA|nr:U24 protein [macacine betaherpesvirus 9]ANC96591.1 U24 protein [macacine betaherpesvirus 9]
MFYSPSPPSYTDVMLETVYNHSALANNVTDFSSCEHYSMFLSEPKKTRRKIAFVILACLTISVILCVILILYVFNMRHAKNKP